ncbi:vacuolar iron transporter homolog 2-like [Wolffia australiana]
MAGRTNGGSTEEENREKKMNADPEKGEVDYLARANWLRAAVLGANDGLVSVASLMVGVGAVSQGAKAMAVSGLAGLVAGACSMAIGEFVSVYTQYDIMRAHKSRRSVLPTSQEEDPQPDKEADQEEEEDEEGLPSPLQAAGASALAFALGGLLPLLAGAFIRAWAARVGVVCAVTTLGLLGFGGAGGFLGGASPSKSALRVLFGGWLAMVVTYGILKLFGHFFQMEISAAA